MFLHTIENQIFRNAAPLAIRHISKPDLRTTHLLARKILDQAAREFQVAPPITIHLADPDLMAGLWCATREAYVVNSKKRVLREAVAAAVSTLNKCPYCVTVHSSMFASAGGDARDLSAPENLTPEISAAYEWAAATLKPDADVLRRPNLPKDDVAQVYATAVLFHYVNRMVSVFLGETPVALPGMMSKVGQRFTNASFTFFGRRMVQMDPEPGQCVSQMDAELPAEFDWARTNPDVAKGLAQFSGAAIKAGEESVSGSVRTVLMNHLTNWQGEEPPLSRAWIEDEVAPLSEQDKPAARLVLTVARAPWQADDELVAGFRKFNRSDRALVQTTAWASYRAARRIASWL